MTRKLGYILIATLLVVPAAAVLSFCPCFAPAETAEASPTAPAAMSPDHSCCTLPMEPQQTPEPKPAQDQPCPAGSDMPHDCPHCQMQSGTTPADDRQQDDLLPTTPVSQQLPAIDFSNPLPVDFQPASISYVLAEHLQSGPPSEPDSLLSQHCLLTI